MDKCKATAYKIQSDIEVATNLKNVLEKRILNGVVKFTLVEVLEITKREFYEIIIWYH